MSAVINVAVEGLVDEAVAVRLIRHVGAEPGPVYGKNGKSHLQKSVNGYNQAARHSPWLVLVDLDRDAECAPPLRSDWLPQPASLLCFRIAVRAIEAWLLADAHQIASFLGVARSSVPNNPEGLENPKAALVELARQSRRRDIREDMVPREGSGRPVGPAFTSRLIEFVNQCWRPEVAAKRSDSLARAICCLRTLVNKPKGATTP